MSCYTHNSNTNNPKKPELILEKIMITGIKLEEDYYKSAKYKTNFLISLIIPARNTHLCSSSSQFVPYRART